MGPSRMYKRAPGRRCSLRLSVVAPFFLLSAPPAEREFEHVDDEEADE